MEFGALVDQVALQAAALRVAAVASGPVARVPTCPGWTVLDLVRHVARIHNWVTYALVTEPDTDNVTPDEPPTSWHSVLSWWDDQVHTMINGLRAGGEGAPAWVFDAEDEPTTTFWARRQAHETAIHRLDAEHARAGSGEVSASLFPADLAVDGIDEVLRLWVPRRVAGNPPSLRGVVRFHATDTGDSWFVRLVAGGPPHVMPSHSGPPDAEVTGTSNAVYRAAWHRPTTAIVTGDHELVAALRTP